MVFKANKNSKNKREYYEYIRSRSWKLFREQALDHFGRKCKKCGGNEKLEVHHKTYKNLFKETFKDVEILCKNCHRGHHKQKIKQNGKKSKYMKDPHYDQTTTTYYPKRTNNPLTICTEKQLEPGSTSTSSTPERGMYSTRKTVNT